jgi:hypothetical protein
LSVLLADWNGSLTPLLRKRLARHLDGCDACKRTNAHARRLSVLASLTVLAPTPAEAMSADRLFDIASRTPAPQERWLPDGFPPYLDESRRRRRLVLAAIGLGVLGALALVVGLASAGGSPKTPPILITPVATVTPSGPASSTPRSRLAPGATVTTPTPTTIAGGPTATPTPPPTTASGSVAPVTAPPGGGVIAPPPTAPAHTPTTNKPAPPTTAKPSPPPTKPAPVTTTTTETVFTF